LPIARYIRDRLGIVQYAITNNVEGTIASCVDQVFALGPTIIREADCLNRAPSVSSVLFMIVLDLIGIQLAERRGITKEQFLLFHPGGSLGKK
jgi:arabinose-5-phosphate isomerase